MSDGALSSEARGLQRELDALSQRMVDLAPRAVPNASGTIDRAEYDRVSARYDAVRERYSAVQDEQLRRAHAAQATTTTRIFVNSDGEATSRRITSQSYEQAQRRLQRDIDSRFKW